MVFSFSLEVLHTSNIFVHVPMMKVTVSGVLFLFILKSSFNLSLFFWPDFETDLIFTRNLH